MGRELRGVARAHVELRGPDPWTDRDGVDAVRLPSRRQVQPLRHRCVRPRPDRRRLASGRWGLHRGAGRLWRQSARTSARRRSPEPAGPPEPAAARRPGRNTDEDLPAPSRPSQLRAAARRPAVRRSFRSSARCGRPTGSRAGIRSPSGAPRVSPRPIACSPPRRPQGRRTRRSGTSPATSPESGFVEMLKITPGVTACRLTIQLRAVASGCEAAVTYTHTSLGPAGDAFVDAIHRGALSPVHAGLGGAAESLPAVRHGASGRA